MNQFQNDLKDYVMSGHALLSITSHERDRCIQQIIECAKGVKRKTFIWAVSTGWLNSESIPLDKNKPALNPEMAIQAINAIPEDSICILKQFGSYLKYETYQQYDQVLSWIDELKQVFSHQGKTIIFLGTDLTTPPQSLSKDITNIDFNLPDKEDIGKAINFVVESVGNNFQPDLSVMPDIINASKGMSTQQVVDRVSLAITKTKKLDTDAVKIILKEKAGVIKGSGYLNYKEPPEGGLSIVGGALNLKRHLVLDKPCFSDEAREYGIDYPKGIVLAGIAGTGKTLFSTAIASEFGLPLISLDVGAIFGSLVGQSEANMREAIKIIDSVSPIVLQLDEVEKAFGGNGDRDGGSSQRVLGTFLSWMNDRTSPVYVVATCNNVSVLPPEFCRAGRFDAIFGISLPSTKERSEIFNIHLKKRKRDPNNFDVNKLAEATEDFSGSDIEQTIKLGLKIGFQQKQELTTNHILTAIDSTIPLAKVEPQRIQEVKEWISKHAKLANPEEIEKPRQVGRKVAIK
jgi:ATP-dependent 26S proteasome regulatory subunit